MLPKKSRLPRSLFPRLLESRSFRHSAHFTLRLAPSESLKVAVSVSKKISKSAVRRNTLRRRVYSALQPIFGSAPTALYLLVAKKGAETLKGQTLEEELKSLIIK